MSSSTLGRDSLTTRYWHYLQWVEEVVDCTAVNVGELREYLSMVDPQVEVVVYSMLGDGSALSVQDLCVGTDQAGPDGEGIEVVIDWEPGAELIVGPS